jgi:voltage-gated potassium channel
MDVQPDTTSFPRWRRKLHEVIFEAETPGGKAFDVILIISIIASVAVVLLESMTPVRASYGRLLYFLEWFFTILFTIEYILRLISVKKPVRYATSFFGVVDLLAVVPTYIRVFIPGMQTLLILRILRLLRIFRIFKLTAYMSAANVITSALKESRQKIGVFLMAVITIVAIIGSFMYVIEGEAHGFKDIPTSIYWAIVTLTTVGYGDLSPATPLGKMLASVVMIMGYGIIAVPTGIVTVELTKASMKQVTTQACPACGSEGHSRDAQYCKYCGEHL